jgi:hypothetical protein
MNTGGEVRWAAACGQIADGLGKRRSLMGAVLTRWVLVHRRRTARLLPCFPETDFITRFTNTSRPQGLDTNGCSFNGSEYPCCGSYTPFELPSVYREDRAVSIESGLAPATLLFGAWGRNTAGGGRMVCLVDLPREYHAIHPLSYHL